VTQDQAVRALLRIAQVASDHLAVRAADSNCDRLDEKLIGSTGRLVHVVESK
jgi:hypothetical protein